MPVPNLTLAQVDGTSIIVGAVALIVGIGVGLLVCKLVIGRTLAQARSEARQILASAETESRTAAQKITLDAERAVLDRKRQFDQELDAAKNEVREQERRLAKREDLIDRKEESLSQKESALSK